MGNDAALAPACQSLQTPSPVLSGGRAAVGAEGGGPFPRKRCLVFRALQRFTSPSADGASVSPHPRERLFFLRFVFLMETIPKGYEVISHSGFDLLKMY